MLPPTLEHEPSVVPYPIVVEMDSEPLRPRKQISWDTCKEESSKKSTASSTPPSPGRCKSSLKSKTVAEEQPASSSTADVEVVVESPEASELAKLPGLENPAPPRPERSANQSSSSISSLSRSSRSASTKELLRKVATPLTADGPLTIKRRDTQEGIEEEVEMDPLLKLVLSVFGLSAGRSIWGLEPWDMQQLVACFCPNYTLKENTHVHSLHEQTVVHSTSNDVVKRTSSDQTGHASMDRTTVADPLDHGGGHGHGHGGHGDGHGHGHGDGHGDGHGHGHGHGHGSLGHGGHGKHDGKPLYRIPCRRHTWGAPQYELHARAVKKGGAVLVAPLLANGGP